MRKRRLGSLEVSVIGMGCNNFGRLIDAEQTRRVIFSALDQGVNFFDTADAYGRPDSKSETTMGEVMGSRRNQMLIATKFGRILADGRGGAKAAYVKSATEASLRRLRTDCIDLMQIHIPDPGTPIEETLAALKDLVAEGKIREIGASNFSVEQLREAATAASGLGMSGFASTQAEYSLLCRKAETGVLAECERLGMTLLPYLPLYNGLLSGKYRAGQPLPAGSRIAGKDAQKRAEILSERNMKMVAALSAYAQARGHTLLELAFAWLLSHPVVPSVIAGMTSPEQVNSNVASEKWELSTDELAEVERLTPIAQ